MGIYNKYLGEWQKTKTYYSSLHKWVRVQPMEITDRVPATLSLLEAREQKVYFKIGQSKKFVFLATPHCNTVGSNMGRYESCQRNGNMMSCDTSYYMGHSPGGQ